MRKNIIETIMGAVVLLVAIVFVSFAFQTSDVQNVEGYQVVASFDNASGLTAGTDVRMAGVKIGTVASNELDTETFLANVTMNIDEAIKLPTDTSARIIPDGLLGGNFVSLEPGGEEENLKQGGVINYTQGAINVVDLLGRFIFSAAESAGGESGGGLQ
ncbi:MAG: outer membrane lipid asymmetry maintenance protein MlaD [Kiloniellales bacterium]|nr:outer membrane lipid asymmetry maintenance protein MlaD [Kiloniellales bacterium]